MRKDVLVEPKKPDDPNQEVQCCYTIGQHPGPIKQKVKLLQHFWSYLKGEGRHRDLVTKVLQNLDDPERIGKAKEHTHDGVVRVRKWFRTRHATIFVLSNKLVQVIFNDATKILLGGETSSEFHHAREIVTWINRKGKTTNYLLKTALEEGDKDLQKKLGYAKDIVLRLLEPDKGSRQKSAATFSSPAIKTHSSSKSSAIKTDPTSKSASIELDLRFKRQAPTRDRPQAAHQSSSGKLLSSYLEPSFDSQRRQGAPQGAPDLEVDPFVLGLRAQRTQVEKDRRDRDFKHASFQR